VGTGAGTGELVTRAPLAGDAIVSDSNYQRYLFYAQEKLANGEELSKLPALERMVFEDWVARGRPGAAGLRVTDLTIAETGPLDRVSRSGLPLTVERTGAEYSGFVKTLEDAKIGGEGAKGAADRMIVADTLFATGKDGTVTFVTTDQGIFNSLARIADPPIDVSSLGNLTPPTNVATAYGGKGFNVRGPGNRTLHVVPIGEGPKPVPPKPTK